jgi:hypothetical protein
VDRFVNLMKQHAARLDLGVGQARFGLVSSVNPGQGTARVTIQPEGVLSGWLPILSPWVGAGWGLSCPPSPGDQVLVVWQEGDGENGVIVGRAWSEQATPPGGAAGELWMVHRSGSFLRLMNDGSIASQAPSWTHHGDLHVSGDVYDGHGPMSALRNHYNVHVHPPDGARPVPTD